MVPSPHLCIRTLLPFSVYLMIPSLIHPSRLNTLRGILGVLLLGGEVYAPKETDPAQP